MWVAVKPLRQCFCGSMHVSSCFNPWVFCTLLLDRSARVIGCWCPGAHDFATWDLLLQHIERPCPTTFARWKWPRMFTKVTKVEIAGSLYVVVFCSVLPLSARKKRKKVRLDRRTLRGACNHEIKHVFKS